MKKQPCFDRTSAVFRSPHALTDQDPEAVRPRRILRRLRRGLITAILVTGCAALGVYFAYRSLLAGVERYTDDNPDALPGVTSSPGDQKKLYGRLAAFRTAVENRRPAPSLTLTTGEINALLAVAPGLGGKVRAEIDGGTVRAQLALPLEDLGFPQFRGRYLNGTADLSLSVVEGELVVRPEAITARAGPLPEVVMARLRKANLARLAFRDPGVTRSLRRLSHVEVRQGAVNITAR
jgi:hypothetical protein